MRYRINLDFYDRAMPADNCYIDCETYNVCSENKGIYYHIGEYEGFVPMNRVIHVTILEQEKES